MRRFTRDGQFWEIELDGKLFHVTNAGKASTRKFVGPEQALLQHDKAIAAQMSEGWTEVQEAPPPPVDDRPIPTDDLDALAVRADELQTRGDYRGELIALQLAHHEIADDEDKLAKRKKLAAQVVTLLGDNGAAVFGPLDDHARATMVDAREPSNCALLVGFRLGVAEWARLAATTRISLSEMWPELMKLPLSRTLRSVTFGSAVPRRLDVDASSTYEPTLAALAKYGVPESVRELSFEPRSSNYRIGALDGLVEQLPHLERLRIQAQVGTFRSFALPALRELELQGGIVSEANVIALTGAAPGLEKLESLELMTAEATFTTMLALATALPALRRLSIHATIVGEDVGQILDGPLLARLTYLDLSYANLFDVGGRTILDNASRFAHLEELDLRQNGFDVATVRAIRAALPKANVYGQLDRVREDEDDRYEGVHE